MKPPAINDSETSVNLRITLACGAIVFCVCLAVIRIPPSEPYWIIDSAAKGVIAERLLASGYRDFSFEHPGGREDPTGHFFPVSGYAVPYRDRFISIFPVTYSALAAPFAALLGPLGLRVPAALGVSACAALLAGWLIPVVGRAWAAGAAMVLALASPLFFYGITVWQHSLTAALSLAAWMLSVRPNSRACWLPVVDWARHLASIRTRLSGRALNPGSRSNSRAPRRRGSASRCSVGCHCRRRINLRNRG